MLKKIVILLLLINFSATAQSKVSDSTQMSFVSRKGFYKLNYNSERWHKSDGETKWDAEFKDSYEIISAYFIEYDYFLPDKNIKSRIKAQFEGSGKVKNLKLYKKKINGLEVNYFECEVDSNDYEYKFQGFTYNGEVGAMEMQFGFQKECSARCQKLVDEFCSGIELLKPEGH